MARVTRSIDLAPTILRRLGAGVPPAMDGESLSAAAARDGCARTEIDLAHPLEPTRFQRASGLDETRCNAAVLRDDRWICVHFTGGLPAMLFDRAEGPAERRDLAADPGGAAEAASDTVFGARQAPLEVRWTLPRIRAFTRERRLNPLTFSDPRRSLERTHMPT